MKFMGWSWLDLKRTPSSIVGKAVERMRAHAEAQAKAGRKGR